MILKRKQITDAASLALVETDKFKANYMSLSFAAPLKRSTASYDALLPLVLSRGCKSLPTMRDINRALDNLYASTLSPRCLRRGETHFFGFSAYTLDNSYAPDQCDIIGGALDILNDILNNPLKLADAFKSEYVESEKSNLCDRIASAINNKNRYAVNRCVEEMCANEAFGIGEYGDIESVQAITPESLYEYYLYMLENLSAEVFYVGRYNDNVQNSLIDILAPLKAKKSTITKAEIISRADTVKRITEDQPVKQAKLSLGYRTGITLDDPAHCNFTVFNEIFSSSPMSKLFRNVREKLSLAYYCHSIPEPLKGIMVVSSGIDASNREKTEAEIARQLDLIRDCDITDDELNAAKASIVNAYRELEDSPEGLERWYTVRMMAGRSDSPACATEDIMGVTREDVAAVARAISLDTVYYMNPTEKDDQGEDEDE